ncbi:unnamed protein product [Blepharisma stoltei]|uniref:Uncharacterized protein n=1 Tax=Blepharisma stoltei TaxID=1481888 RepID=A0AAU9JHB7_9CILI|nr:unnamed protein product [Blepharisma stoltei]
MIKLIIKFTILLRWRINYFVDKLLRKLFANWKVNGIRKLNDELDVIFTKGRSQKKTSWRQKKGKPVQTKKNFSVYKQARNNYRYKPKKINHKLS